MAYNKIEGTWKKVTKTTQSRTMIDSWQLIITVDGREIRLSESLKVFPHSPTGFNVGYGGSGPAQAALGILLAVTHDKVISVRLHQDFKWEYIAPLDQHKNFAFEMDVMGWVKAKMALPKHADWLTYQEQTKGMKIHDEI